MSNWISPLGRRLGMPQKKKNEPLSPSMIIIESLVIMFLVIGTYFFLTR